MNREELLKILLNEEIDEDIKIEALHDAGYDFDETDHNAFEAWGKENESYEEFLERLENATDFDLTNAFGQRVYNINERV